MKRHTQSAFRSGVRCLSERFRAYCAVVILCTALSAAAQTATWTPNFRDSDILEVIRAVQDVTGKTMVVDPRVRGQITVISTTPVDAEGYFSIFLRALDINGFTAVEGADGILSIVPSQEARAAPLPLVNGSPDPNGYATEVIQLDNVHVNQVIQVVRPLVSSANAQLSAYPDANLLVLVDTAANIERIRAVLQRIDAAASPATDVIPLEFADAGEVARLVQDMNPSRAVEGEGVVQTGLQVAADLRSNAILVSGDLRQRERARDLIARLDQPQEQSGNTRVIYLEFASAANIAEVLESIIQRLAAEEG
ncbi:MAG: secretin N-terminal domain-containing protein, partial [Pseudohongiellaceae bacterium]